MSESSKSPLESLSEELESQAYRTSEKIAQIYDEAGQRARTSVQVYESEMARVSKELLGQLEETQRDLSRRLRAPVEATVVELQAQLARLTGATLDALDQPVLRLRDQAEALGRLLDRQRLWSLWLGPLLAAVLLAGIALGYWIGTQGRAVVIYAPEGGVTSDGTPYVVVE